MVDGNQKIRKKLYSGGIRLYKLVILTITFGSFVFAGSWEDTYKTIEKSDSVKNQFCLAEDKDDFKLERRRRGKGNTKRRRGGNGLR